MAFLVADPFRDAIRSEVTITYTVDATLGGSAVATGLQPTGGTITDTTKPGVRRVLNLELADEDGLYDALTPYGTQLVATAHVQYTNRVTVDIPMGVFDVDAEKVSEGGGALSLTAPDKWRKIQRARFIGPGISTPGLSVPDQIAALIRDALGPSEPVNILTSNAPSMPAQVWEKDRDQAILDLAKSIGCWVYFDRTGVATIADIPTIGDTADWLVDSSASGVLIELDRERSRTTTRNVIVISSSAADGERFPTQYVWDSDPASPTYAGTNPMYGVGVGPFGVVVDYFDSPILSSADEALAAGRTILARSTGLASQVSLGQVPNPAVDAFDVLDVLPPGRKVSGVGYLSGGFGRDPFGSSPFGVGSGSGRPQVTYSSTRVIERHVADTVTHPLAVGGNTFQSIEGRSTRTDGAGL